MQDGNSLPIPPKEKLTRWLMYLGVAGALVGGTLLVGPYVLAALNTAFAIGQAALALGGLALGGALLALIVYNFAPLVKNGIEIAAYKMWEKMIDDYPIAHMHIWRAKVLEGIDESERAKKELAGIVGENNQQLKTIDDELKELETTIKDPRTSQSTRDSCLTDLAGKRELRKPYARVVDSLTPAIEGFDQFISIQQKYAKKLSQEIDVADANFRADQSLRKGQAIWERVMGKNQAKANSEAAKKRVEQQLGNSLGKLEDMRKQMAVMVQAAARKDEIAMANARKYMADQLNTIDVPFVEVKEVQPAKVGTLLNLN